MIAAVSTHADALDAVSATPRLSLVIVAADEGKQIGDCIASAAGLTPHLLREIVLIEDGPQPATAAAARTALAGLAEAAPQLRVVCRRYDGHGRQMNFAFEQARGEWLLVLDCDERLSAELAAEIPHLIANPGGRIGFYFPRRNIVFGRWLRHGGNYPDWQLRLTRRNCARYSEHPAHPIMRLNGPTGRVRAPLLHDSYPDLQAYLHKLNRYTTGEASYWAASGRRYSARRMWFVALGNLWRRGVRHLALLDGMEGATYVLLQFAYDLTRHWKLREFTRGPRRKLPMEARSMPGGQRG